MRTCRYNVGTLRLDHSIFHVGFELVPLQALRPVLRAVSYFSFELTDVCTDWHTQVTAACMPRQSQYTRLVCILGHVAAPALVALALQGRATVVVRHRVGT